MTSLPEKVSVLTALFLFLMISLIYIGNQGSKFQIVTSPGAPPLKELQVKGIDLLERAVFIERQDRLQRECQTYKRRQNALQLNVSHYTPEAIWDNKEVLDHIIVDQKHQLLYCYVPKVACTNWKRTLLYLSGSTNVTKPIDIPSDYVHRTGVFPKLSNFSEEHAAHMLKTFTTFLIVRHPFERLLSAYRNKLEQKSSSSKYFQTRIGRHIIKTYRKNPSNHSLQYGHDVTFSEFATYLGTENGPGGEYNEHWKPIHQLCAPCAIRYDIIGKYETLYDDADYLLHQLGEPTSAFPRYAHPSNTTATLGKYFGTLSVDLLRKMYSVYETDFRLFGYNLQEFLGFEID
ncbi:carbohydrate sulfotransferase 11 [Frankliniella occidentalis]|uniref:Carbohydrate sulfotransferase n=1 Tax=Frankliniella occidentalis TaxID=133901 RepID=A0A6J1TI94_FRAOC|nr:carbohydrate sulfotransferase 11 [Frankliniella occidentalis]